VCNKHRSNSNQGACDAALATNKADFRHASTEIPRQSVSDRQHDREGSSGGQRGKRGKQKQAIGISRGGRSTKIHANVDSKGRPCRIKDWRRIATRYDKVARNFLAAAALVGALYWIKL
jgi:transposase